MQCSGCGYPDTRVVDTNKNDKDNTIRRRRECLRCSLRFTTSEQLHKKEKKTKNES